MALLLSDLIDDPVSVRREGDGLWLDAATFTRVTGFTLKPEGFCRGALCIPVPPQRALQFVNGDALNVRAFAEQAGQVLVADDGGEHWMLSESAGARRSQLVSGIAPDFALPDIDGNIVRLSDLRGKKVLLASWASW